MTGVQTCALPICFPVTILWQEGSPVTEDSKTLQEGSPVTEDSKTFETYTNSGDTTVQVKVEQPISDGITS